MKAGIFSIGLDTYWPQFDGLLDNLNGYHAQIRDRIAGMGIELVDAGMVDKVEKAHGAAKLFKQQDVEVIFLFISTYALSSTVLPVVQKTKVPVVMLNLQPVAQLDYEKFNALGVQFPFLLTLIVLAKKICNIVIAHQLFWMI